MLYSFVVPIYNDAYLAEDFILEFERVFRNFLQSELIESKVELIFVCDGGKDENIQTLIGLSGNFNFVRVVELSRNFGQHIALSCGYNLACGRYIGMLNVDMQDPPYEIPRLINEIETGKYDIVYSLSDYRDNGFLNNLSSKLFNQFLNYLTQSKTPINISTLRVMNRKFIDSYNSLKEKSRYIPGLENWLGFKSSYVKITTVKRVQGKSSYTFSKRWRMALNAIISFSDYPLRLLVKVGALISIIGFILLLFLVISKLFFINYLPGYVSLVFAIVFFSGLQILTIGLASLYTGRILNEVQNRPLYIIRNKFNFKD